MAEDIGKRRRCGRVKHFWGQIHALFKLAEQVVANLFVYGEVANSIGRYYMLDGSKTRLVRLE